MKRPVERPYVLFVAEYIYLKVCEIKKKKIPLLQTLTL